MRSPRCFFYDLTRGVQCPTTNKDWISWLESNEDYWRGLLVSAPATRSQLAKRVFANEEDFPAARRYYPERVASPSDGWRRALLHNGNGWFVLVGEEGPRVPFFAASLHGETLA